ncbi:MAG: hypothetical protein Q4G03_03645 [Planctomycetia bacterium]|nr:hypothetical protein [Planctomycetia bacterium]
MKFESQVYVFVSKIFVVVTNLVKMNFVIQGRSRIKTTPPGYRQLRLEGLESRELLDSSGLSCASPSYEQHVLRQIAQAYEAEQASPIYPTPFLDSLHDVNADSDSVISLVEQDLCDSQSLADSDELFANQGLYILGEPYVALSFAQKNQMCLYYDNVDEEPIEAPTDEGVPTWNLEFQVTRYCSDSSATTPEGADYALHEGHGSVLSFPGSLGDPASSDYLAVTLPALPDGYMATVTLGGTASVNDYYVFIPYDGGSTSVTNGYVHSGGAAVLYIVPVDDRQTESLETVSLTMGAPYYDFEPETFYSFNNINTSVTATIVDNDDWIITVYPVLDDSELGYTLLTEEEQTEALFRVARVDAGSGYGEDKHYAIDATLRFDGSATANGYDADYNVYLNNANGSRTLLTPNYSGVFTVRIPENELFATLTVKANNDAIVERLYETIDISVTSAASYPLSYISYNVSSESVQARIKDNDVFRVSTVKFLDNLDLLSDSTDSFGTNWKNLTHWYKDDSTKTLPVAYSSDAAMKCQITLDGISDYTQTYQVRMKWNRLNGSAVYSDWQTVSVYSPCVVELNSNFASIFGCTQAYYDSSSEIDWEFKISGDDDRDELGEMGTSSNPLYVAYKAPLSGCTNYLSLMHLGCSSAYAANASTDASVFQAIWNVVAAMSIHKVDCVNGAIVNGDLLTYYGQEPSSEYFKDKLYDELAVTKLSDTDYLVDQVPSLAREVAYKSNNEYTLVVSGSGVDSLLYYTDGTCNAWRDLAYHLFRIQGISVEKMAFRVKNDRYLKVKPNILGQGGVVPKESIWQGHALIDFNGVIYDPSYGLCYGVLEFALTKFIENLHSIGISTANKKTNETEENDETEYLKYGWTYTPVYESKYIIKDDFTILYLP